MTASDYIAATLYYQHEQAVDLRNERRRVALERAGAGSAVPEGGRPHGLAYALRLRLAALVTDAPARG